jgi:hypothetical protein
LAYDGCAPLLKQRAALFAAHVVRVCLHGGDASDHHSTYERECRLAAYTARVSAQPPGPDPGYVLLRTLADQARLGQLARARPDLLHALVDRLGVSGAERVLEDYLDACPPQRWTEAEGSQFDRWLQPLTSAV